MRFSWTWHVSRIYVFHNFYYCVNFFFWDRVYSKIGWTICLSKNRRYSILRVLVQFFFFCEKPTRGKTGFRTTKYFLRTMDSHVIHSLRHFLLEKNGLGRTAFSNTPLRFVTPKFPETKPSGRRVNTWIVLPFVEFFMRGAVCVVNVRFVWIEKKKNI